MTTSSSNDGVTYLGGNPFAEDDGYQNKYQNQSDLGPGKNITENA